MAIVLSDPINDTDPFFDEAPPFEDAVRERLIVDLDGFAGPLDMLLELARRQKVDLASISILRLSEQYLEFVHRARDLHIDLAADYLVMAAWLAYLKSRLLVPHESDDEEPTGEELAQMLHFRLKRLNAMRDAAEALNARAQLGRSRFATAHAQSIKRLTHIHWQADYLELLKAYAERRQAGVKIDFKPVKREVISLEKARNILNTMLGVSKDWQSLQSYLHTQFADKQELRSALATGFSVSLELAKQGKVELSQSDAFAPLYIRTPVLGADEMGGQKIA